MNGNTTAAHVTAPDMLLVIETLGRFVVRQNNRVLTNQVRQSKKTWDLLKFFLTYRNKSFLPDAIVDQLWPDACYDNPKNLLRTQIHRLRKLLGEDAENGRPSVITYAGGSYAWNPDAPCQVDADLFEFLSHDARQVKDSDPDASILRYRQALDYYKGDYLPECAEEEWVIPLRIHYRRLFIENVLDLCHLLDQQQGYSSVLDVCEKAMLLESCEESIHQVFLDTLLKMGKSREALQHYRYVTGLYYREMGVVPSRQLKETYRQIQETMSPASPDLNSFPKTPDRINRNPAAPASDRSAYLCPLSVFQSLLEVEQRRCERQGSSSHLSLFTINASVQPSTAAAHLKELELFLVKHLRRADTLTRWNQRSIAVLFSGLSEESVRSVVARILDSYHEQQPNSSHAVDVTFQSLPADMPDSCQAPDIT